MGSTWYEGFVEKEKRPPARMNSCNSTGTLPLVSLSTDSLRRSKSESSMFHARQNSHPSVAKKKHFANIAKDLLQEARESEDVEFWGAKGIPGFREYLTKKFGSVVAGWRALDEDQNGRLSFYEFCNACRRMGYHGNLKKLWRDLDHNKTGFVSLMKIDPEVGQLVGSFKLALIKKYGDMLTAWQKGIDTNGDGRIQQHEIEQAVQRLGLPIDGKKLFSYLVKTGSIGLTLKEFDPDSWNRFVSSDTKGHVSTNADDEFFQDMDLSKTSMDLVECEKKKGEGARAWRRELAERDRAGTAAAREETTRLRLGLHTVDGFKEALIQRCGSLWGAWRNALDLDGNGRITFGEFTQALSRLGFHGNVRGLFKALDVKGQGSIAFSEFDSETHVQIEELREKLKQMYGNLLLAWIKGLDPNGSGCCDEDEFIGCCKKVGFSGDAQKLFKLMQPDNTRKFLVLSDFDTPAYQAMSRNDFRMLTEPEGKRKPKPLEMSFEERNSTGFFFDIRKAWDASKREEFAKACLMAKPTEYAINTQEEFHQLCMRKFGSMIGAWRNCLDSDGNGKLTFNEFCAASRRLGFEGNLKKLFAEYDTGKKGYLSLKDMDAEAYELTSSFLTMLAEKYGDLDTAWRECFEQDPYGSIDLSDLLTACEALGYPYDAKKLFKCLQPVPGRQLITIWDLDPECTKDKARGGSGAIRSGEKHGTRRPTLVDVAAEQDLASAENSTMAASQNADATNSTLRSSHQSSCSSRWLSQSMMGQVSANQLLRNSLTQKCGSTVAAWRGLLDPNNTGGVIFRKFILACEHVNFAGNVKSLWQDLARNRTACEFRDIDPDMQEFIDEARTLLVGKFGSLLMAWYSAINVADLSSVDQDEFVRNMQAANVQMKTPKDLPKLFKMLLAHRGQRSIKREDMGALLIGIPREERLPLWMGKDNASQKSKHGTSTNLPSARENVDLRRSAVLAKDTVMNSIIDFKKMLVVKFGSLFAAWRHHLDQDQNGVVTQKDFSQACVALGVRNARTLWMELDENKNGQISLWELDAQLGDDFAAFESLLIAGWGSTKAGWRTVFDSNGSLRCEKHDFVKACKKIGFSGDADKLFGDLRPEPGRSYLTYEDVFLNLNPNDFAPSQFNPHRKPRDSKSPLGRSQASSPNEPHPKSPQAKGKILSTVDEVADEQA